MDGNLPIDYSSIRLFFGTLLITAAFRPAGTRVRINSKDLILDTLILFFILGVVWIEFEHI